MTVVWRQASVLVDAEFSCQPERCCTKTLSVSCTLCLLTKQYNSVPAGIQEHYATHWRCSDLWELERLYCNGEVHYLEYPTKRFSVWLPLTVRLIEIMQANECTHRYRSPTRHSRTIWQDAEYLENTTICSIDQKSRNSTIHVGLSEKNWPSTRCATKSPNFNWI